MSFHTRCHKIGLFIEVTAGRGGYQSELWSGIADTIREQNASLICFAGGALESAPVDKYERMRNIIYKLANSDIIDGLIVSSTIGTFVEQKKLLELCDSYQPLKIVSTGVSLPNIPSVLVDDAAGIRDIITHLVQEHKYSRIGFIRGPENNPEAKIRYQAYRNILTEYGLPFDDRQVVQGDFFSKSGYDAINILLDKNKVDIDVIVAANDNMAIGAFEALQKRGIHVPIDLAIVGFDDTEDAVAIEPSLTTVRHPVYKQGQCAAEKILALLNGEQVTDKEILPTKLIIRQSCGCGDKTQIQYESNQTRDENKTFNTYINIKNRCIETEIVAAIVASIHIVDQGDLNDLMIALFNELRDVESGQFISKLEKILNGNARKNVDVYVWHKAIRIIYQKLRPYICDDKTLCRTESLFLQAYEKIGNIFQQSYINQKLHSDQRMETLNKINQELATISKTDDVENILAKRLPELGISRCYISFYKDPKDPMGYSRLIFTFDSETENHLQSSYKVFRTKQMLPNDILSKDKSYSFVVEPLYIQDNHLGYAIFERGPKEGIIYESLRGQLSSAFWALHLHEFDKERIRHLEIINDVTMNMTTQLYTENILETIAAQIAEKLQCSHCSIFMPKIIQNIKYMVAEVVKSVEGENIKGRKFKIGEGLVCWIYQKGYSKIYSNALTEPHFIPARRSVATPRSMVAVPIKSKGETIGVICADKDGVGMFKESDLKLVESLSLQASIAIEHRKSLGRLESISNQIIDFQNSDLILKNIVREAIKITNTTTGVIYLLNKDCTNVIRSFYPRETDFVHPEPRLNKPDGLTRQVFITGKVIKIPDVKKDKRVNEKCYRFHSLVAVPLKFIDRVIGVLFLNDDNPHIFTDVEISLLTTLAGQAAVVLEGARLLEESKQRLETVTILLESLQHFKKTNINTLEGLESAVEDILINACEQFNAEDVLFIASTPKGYHEIVGGTKTIEQHMLELVVQDLDCKLGQDARKYICHPIEELCETRKGMPSCQLLVYRQSIPDIGNTYILYSFEDKARVLEDDKLKLADLFTEVLLATYTRFLVNQRVSSLKSAHDQANYGQQIDVMSMGFGHEAKNSLNAANAIMKNMIYMIKNKPPEEVSKTIMDLKTVIDDINNLVLKYLRFTRPVEKKYIFLSDVVEVYLSLYKKYLKDEQMNLHENLAPYLSSSKQRNQFNTIYADQGHIGQIIGNLLTNAVAAKTNPKAKGSLEIITKIESPPGIQSRRADKWAMLQVLDYGKGIPKEKQSLIWQAGYTTKENGNGLGLHIVRRIVEEHNNGIIELNSVENKGTCFSVYFPIVRKDNKCSK